MKPRSCISKVLAVAAGFLLGSATAVSAGVVMSETAIASGPIGGGIQHRTIYVQGNKQKVDSEGVQTITDLDKHLIYIIDKTNKKYVELPLTPAGKALRGSPGPTGAAIELKRTGGTRVIADNKCEEYRGREANGQVQITVSACVAKSAPGAQEIARFDRAMLDQIGAANPKTTRDESAGVVLQKKSVLNLRVPNPGAHATRSASLMTKTTVNGISVKPLAEQTFAPPKGYSKLQNHPPEHLPDNVRSVFSKHPQPTYQGSKI